MILRRSLTQGLPILRQSSPCFPRMPLRAKIHPSALQEQSYATSVAAIPRELPGDDPDDVIFSSLYGVRTIQLNRPKKLNSLSGSMARKIIPRLMEWEKSQLANVVVISGAGEKAFCAGGDVAELAALNKTGPEGQAKSADYFALEYRLDHLIGTYTKPYIAYMDGITMGGGVGLSVHAPFRIATERTVFAMPETTIGFFPDVGASFFLPRLNGQVGTYLAMTSARLKGIDVLYSGIATHYLHSSSLPELTNRLAELQFSDVYTDKTKNDLIARTIEEYSPGVPYDQPPTIAGGLRKAIDRCFSAPTVIELVTRLQSETGETAEWASETLKTLNERSPTSLHVTLKLMQAGWNWSFDEAFQREYALAKKFMAHPDFVTGVEAKLVHKSSDRPKWSPSALTDKIDTAEFLSVKGQQRLPLLREPAESPLLDYEHALCSLPKEDSIKKAIEAGPVTTNQLLSYLRQEYGFKPGLEAVVQEVLDRNTEPAPNPEPEPNGDDGTKGFSTRKSDRDVIIQWVNKD